MNLYKNLSLLLIFGLFISVASADTSLSERMKARLPDVIAAKSKGLVGENTDGLLLLRNSNSNSNLIELVKAENRDRILLFKQLAEKTGASQDDVALKFAKAIASKAQKGHWFKNSSGNWVSK